MESNKLEKRKVGRPLKNPFKGPSSIAERASSYRARIDVEIDIKESSRWSKNACLRVLKLDKYSLNQKLQALHRLKEIIESSI